MTGAALVAAVVVLVIGVVVAYRAGVRTASRNTRHATLDVAPPVPPTIEPTPLPTDLAQRAQTAREVEPSEAWTTACAFELPQLRDFAEDRRALLRAVADARADVARYRQIVVDIERNAPPPLLDAPGAPDDLKLIVGVGPVIERMLYQLGIGTYRQIARWSERDIDDFDARLEEFPGRIRRDGWVTQARALHIGKYGTPP